MSDTKIAMLTAVWGRPELTRMMLEYYEEMPIDELYGVFGFDDPDECNYDSDRWDWWGRENSPLSNKWQSGIDYIRALQSYDGHKSDIDAVMIMGSDDFVSPQYIEACKGLIASGVDYIYMDGAYFYDTVSGRMMWAHAEKLGLGRCISARLLDRMDWQLWPAGMENGLDGAMDDKIRAMTGAHAVCLKDARKRGLYGMDVKTDQNLWSYDHIRNNLLFSDINAEKVLPKLFPTISDKLLTFKREAV
ncbi:hypothetical protein OAF54_02800 [bacterium]|nr:hypothetical protein [bacterium]